MQKTIVIEYDDERYPEQLKEIADAPKKLYCRGDVSLLQSEHLFAIVGTRNITSYGKQVTELFARELCMAGLVIVSGLARGVDTLAHKTALENGCPTIAVLGNGFDHIYPAENAAVYAEIAEKGLLVSEYPPETMPMPYYFPARNRIISGLSKGVLATEGGIESGSIITLNLAIDHNREPFTVPGSIFMRQSKGTNAFMKKYPPSMVTEPNDILEFFGYNSKISYPTDLQLDINEQLIYSELENELKLIEDLIEITNISYNSLLALLTQMEIKGLIRRQPGNFYSI